MRKNSELSHENLHSDTRQRKLGLVETHETLMRWVQAPLLGLHLCPPSTQKKCYIMER